MAERTTNETAGATSAASGGAAGGGTANGAAADEATRWPHPARAALLAGRRVGFACVVTGRPGLRAADARRPDKAPHLRVSLGYLRAIFAYLDEIDVRMYRLSSGVAPYVTHPELPQFWHQVAECADELAEVGALAARLGLRLSTHPAQYTLLNAQDEAVAAAGVRDLTYHAALLDALGCGPEARIVTHVGGLYGDRPAALDRFCRRYEALAPAIRARLVVENDERLFGLGDVLALHARVGVPVCWDWLHHAAHDPDGVPAAEAVRLATATWPAGVLPKIHFSSQRRAPVVAVRRDRRTGVRGPVARAPRRGEHADYLDPDDVFPFLAAVRDVPFDIMVEAKEKDRAVLALRDGG